MPARGSSKDPRYRGLDERGYPVWMGDCGHLIASKRAKVCKACYNVKKSAPNYLGVVGGRQMYRASECGHAARREDAKRCRACTAASALKNHPYSKGYYPVAYIKGGKGRQRKIHIMKAEAALGRPLKPGEVVHHINMDKFDHRNCNLLVCDRSYHRYLHHAMQLAYARGLVPPP